MTASLPGFKCEVIHTKHTVESCVARHRKREDPCCRRCPVGVEHAAGKLPTHWPPERGGAPIVRLPIVPFDRIPSRRRRTRPPPAA